MVPAPARTAAAAARSRRGGERSEPPLIARCWLNNFDVLWVMGQVGHEDSKMTMDVYAQLQQRVKREHGRAFDPLVRRARRRLNGSDGARQGRHRQSLATGLGTEVEVPRPGSPERPARETKKPCFPGFQSGETRTRTGDTTIFSQSWLALEPTENPCKALPIMRTNRGRDLRKYRSFLASSGDRERLVSQSSRPVATARLVPVFDRGRQLGSDDERRATASRRRHTGRSRLAGPQSRRRVRAAHRPLIPTAIVVLARSTRSGARLRASPSDATRPPAPDRSGERLAVNWTSRLAG